jgi:hypothetical protein
MEGKIEVTEDEQEDGSSYLLKHAMEGKIEVTGRRRRRLKQLITKTCYGRKDKSDGSTRKKNEAATG